MSLDLPQMIKTKEFIILPESFLKQWKSRDMELYCSQSPGASTMLWRLLGSAHVVHVHTQSMIEICWPSVFRKSLKTVNAGLMSCLDEYDIVSVFFVLPLKEADFQCPNVVA